jgi:hypothetical protein
MLVAGSTTAQGPPQLAVQGSLMSGGWSRLTIEAPDNIGAPTLVFAGLTPLPLEAPVSTGKGKWYVGDMILVLSLGPVPPAGMVDITFAIPVVDPLLYGITLALQAYVPSRLSNPATLPLDAPYLLLSHTMKLTAPTPKLGANFGDASCAGDFNADGSMDLAVGSWFEDWLGIDKSGRVYVFWGPDFTVTTALQSGQPKNYGEFGASLIAADLDNDGIDDLVIGENTGDPPQSTDFAHVHVYFGGQPFVTTPGLTLTSPGGGIEYVAFGRYLSVADFDADGWRDIAAGAEHATVAGLTQAGRVDVYWGPNFSQRATLTSPDNGQDAFFGSTLASGDVDGDGMLDLVEGGGRDDVNGVENAGSVHVFSGGSRALTHLATLHSPLPAFFNARFGDSLTVGDFDDDGIDELAVGELSDHAILFRDLSGMDYTLITKPPSSYANPFGETVFSDFLRIADVNGDGAADVAVSDYFDGSLAGCPVASGGILYVALAPYFASFLRVDDPVQECGATFSWFPTVIDLDLDGRIELIVPAHLDDEGSITNAGHVTIFDSN